MADITSILKKNKDLQKKIDGLVAELERRDKNDLSGSGLKQNEEFYTCKNIYDSLSEAIFLLDANWCFLEVNKGAEKMYGYTASELIGKSAFDLTVPGMNELNAFQKSLVDVLKNGDTKKIELWALRKSGKDFFTEIIINRTDFKGQQVLILTVRDVTERKLANQEIVKFKMISDKAMHGNVIVDLNGVISYVNDYFANIHGYKADALIGKNMNIFYKKDYQKRVDELNQKLLVNGSYSSEEVWHVHRDGTEFLMLMNGVVFKDESGIPKFMAVLAVDISELRKSEEALRKSEEKFRAFYYNAPLSFQSLDKNGYLIDVNPAWLLTLGYKREEVIGKNYADFLHKDWINHFEKNFPAFKDRGYINDVHFRLRHKKGHFIDVALEGCIGYHSDGSFGQTYCVFKDITIQKKAEYALIESEARFRGIFEHANIGIALADQQTNIIEANNEFLTMLEYDKDEIKGMSFDRFTHPGDIAAELYFIQQLRKGTRESYRIEKRYISKSNKVLWVDLSVTVWRNEAGNIDLFIGMVMDISKAKKTAEDLVSAKERAEESDRLKSAFLANVSHEIRTPMNGILGFAELLEHPSLSIEQQHKYIEIIRKSGERMLNTVNDIIDISKIDAGQVSFERSKVDLKEDIEMLYLFFKPEAEKKGLEFRLITQLHTNNHVIETDKAKFNSIITNLVKNAIKYTDRGSIELCFSIKNDEFNFKVTDTGIGIPDARKSAIFNRFEQADIDDEYAREGSGLGLAIALSYAKIIGGEISFDSEQGVGSVFSFSMPISAVEIVTSLAQAETVPPIQTKQMNILIAEDDDISFLHLSLLLKNMAKNILRAKNGAEAIEMAKNNLELDCIFMDVKMPVVDGYRASQQIRVFNKQIPIIAQTAYALKGEEGKALNAGCTTYISKPINKNELFAKVNACFDS